MPLPRVTGVIWWKMSLSHYKAIFRRARVDERPFDGYTKDFLQAPRSIRLVLREMFAGQDPPYEPITYRWPGGSFAGGKIYAVPDRLEVGQWTQQGAPHPWQIGDSAADPTLTLPGSPDAAIPDEANAQWEDLEELEPWLMMIQLEGSTSELQLRAYLGAPTADLIDADLSHVPEKIRRHMTGQGGLAGAEMPAVWFDPDDFRDPWRTSADDSGREASRAAEGFSGSGRAQREVGAPYKDANETATSAAPEPFEVDPNERDRATRAHAVTQNALAQVVRDRGLKPLSPTGEPNYDLAWREPDGTMVVVEVKSITARNEERQLRLGLGQVLRYRNLVAAGGINTRALLVVSAEPSDPRWRVLCESLDVGLLWPPMMDERLAAWLST